MHPMIRPFQRLTLSIRQAVVRHRRALALLVPGSLMMAGCGLVPQKHIYTEIEIQAPPEQVWAILADNARYPQWNPYHVRVEGEMQVGSTLEVEIHKPNGDRVEIDPEVMRLSPPNELTWGGGVQGIFFGEHVFLLSPVGEAATRLVHKETFSGFAIPFASLETIEEGYHLMNRALKHRAESAN